MHVRGGVSLFQFIWVASKHVCTWYDVEMSRKRSKQKGGPSLWGEDCLLFLLLSFSFDSPQRPLCAAPAGLLGVSQFVYSSYLHRGGGEGGGSVCVSWLPVLGAGALASRSVGERDAETRVQTTRGKCRDEPDLDLTLFGRLHRN